MKPAYKPVLCVVSSHPIKGASGVPTGFFLAELTHPLKVLEDAGIKTTIASIRGGQPPVDGFDLSDPVNAWYWNETDFQQRLATTPALSELKGADYSAVFFAGGHGTMWDFRDNQDAQRIIREVYESDGIVSAVCHGPAALVDAKLSSGEYLIKGKNVAAFTNKEQSAQPVSDMLEASLGRLGVDAIDIYWIHNPLDVEKWTPGLIPLLQSGKVKRVGVSNHNLAQIRRANEILNASGYSLSAVQNHYSLLYRASEEAGILDYCRQNNITFFAYMVLEQGALSGRYDSNHPMPAGSGRAESYNAVLPQIERLTAAMKKMGAERNASVAQIAIAWAIAKGTLPLVGATKVHHVLDAACASDIQLRDEEIILLEQLAAETRVDTRGAWEKPMG
ncbi:aldo/keto reductase [Escherichia coli]|nr:aldo/keto reductase [Escherichia coli]MCC5020044.1 aldo/keto reductase [Escherichia coli]